MTKFEGDPSFGVVKGSDPEQFVVVWRKDFLITRMDFHSEAELRAICKRGGMAESQMEYLIGEARKHPV
jgi:hypothetical protein